MDRYSFLSVHTDKAKTTRLVISRIYVYTLWGRNLVYPFTLRVTGSENTRRMTPYLLKSYVPFKSNSKEERYSRVPRLSSTPYSANGTKGKWRCKARLKCATYRRFTDLSVMGVRVGMRYGR